MIASVESINTIVIGAGQAGLANSYELAQRGAAEIHQIHSADYRNPAALPAGGVLVVGTGNSGSQIAEELARAERVVYLSVGHSGLPLRRYRGKDMYWWYQKAKLHQFFRFESGSLRGVGNTTGCDGDRVWVGSELDAPTRARCERRTDSSR